MNHHPLRSLMAVTVCLVNAYASDAEPVTLQNVIDPGPNQLDEPVADQFSLERAIHFLDSASLQWQNQRKCFTCHTNFAYLYARPAVADNLPAPRIVRDFAESLVRDRWPDQGPRWDAEVVAAAAALAFNDAKVTGSLHPLTRAALDRMWTVQREDGAWDWLKCGWPPMESDDHYGATLAAIAVGVAPDGYQESEPARRGMVKLRDYLRANSPPTLHHQGMLLWATTYHDVLLTRPEKQASIDDLFSLQKEDGGWALATLGDWERADGKAQDTSSSDGYGTGFVIFVLRQAGVSKMDDRIQKGIRWLLANQRESGRWITRSLNRDNKHFISHAGSAFAIMALAECDSL